MPDPLIARWRALAENLGLKHADAIGEDLLARYREPHRRFHTPAHLAQVLDLLEELGADPRLRLAAWFHDAIYRPGRRDNERKSARLARQRLGPTGMPDTDIAFVERAVLATADHSNSESALHPLLDADLAVLGDSPEAYRTYVSAIRDEFAKIPALLFNPARVRFLRSLLARQAIYLTPQCQHRLELQARQNLQSELDHLTGG